MEGKEGGKDESVRMGEGGEEGEEMERERGEGPGAGVMTARLA